MYNTDCKHKNRKQTKCKGRIVVVSGIVIIRNIRSAHIHSFILSSPVIFSMSLLSKVTTYLGVLYYIK